MYTAYVLDEAQREQMLQDDRFLPMYKDVIAHHITDKFGVKKNAEPPAQPQSVRIIGHAFDSRGLEAFAVVVDGRHVRDDGKIFHITWSLDKSVFKPKDSNTLLLGGFTLITPYELKVTPQVLR